MAKKVRPPPRRHRLRKNARIAHNREGHEFHSCRKWRRINSGFQPLGDCQPTKRLFPHVSRVSIGNQPIPYPLCKGSRIISAKQIQFALTRYFPSASPVLPVVATFSGRSCGNRITSRIVCESVNNIASRSMPTPTPPAGGMPYESARM